MRLIFTLFLLLCSTQVAYSQKNLKEFYLKRTLKQDGEQFNFLILDEDKRGVWCYSKRKFYYWYKAQHVLRTQGGASGILLHGEFESFYASKQLAKKGDFNRGLKNGEWLYWREDGTLRHSESWKKGKKIGWEKWYNENGDVFQTSKHKRNRSTFESKDSTIVSKRNGKIQTAYYRDEQGKTERVEERKDGQLHGEVKTFENGELISTEKYKHGEFIPAKAKKDSDSLAVDGERKWWQIFKKKAPKEEVKEKSTDKNENKDTKATPEPEKKGIKNWFKRRTESAEAKKEQPEKENAVKKEDKKKKSSDDKKSKP